MKKTLTIIIALLLPTWAFAQACTAPPIIPPYEWVAGPQGGGGDVAGYGVMQVDAARDMITKMNRVYAPASYELCSLNSCRPAPPPNEPGVTWCDLRRLPDTCAKPITYSLFRDATCRAGYALVAGKCKSHYAIAQDEVAQAHGQTITRDASGNILQRVTSYGTFTASGHNPLGQAKALGGPDGTKLLGWEGQTNRINSITQPSGYTFRYSWFTGPDRLRTLSTSDGGTLGFYYDPTNKALLQINSVGFPNVSVLPPIEEDAAPATADQGTSATEGNPLTEKAMSEAAAGAGGGVVQIYPRIGVSRPPREVGGVPTPGLRDAGLGGIWFVVAAEAGILAWPIVEPAWTKLVNICMSGDTPSKEQSPQRIKCETEALDAFLEQTRNVCSRLRTNKAREKCWREGMNVYKEERKRCRRLYPTEYEKQNPQEVEPDDEF